MRYPSKSEPLFDSILNAALVSPSSESLSTLLATWDDSISLQDAEELNRLIREARRSKTEPPRLELTE